MLPMAVPKRDDDTIRFLSKEEMIIGLHGSHSARKRIVESLSDNMTFCATKAIEKAFCVALSQNEYVA